MSKGPVRDGYELADKNPEAPIQRAIGQQIRKMRLAKNLTVSDLSKVASTSVAMISKIENGQTSPSLSTLNRIANGLSTTMSSLFSQYEEYRDVSYVPAGKGIEIERRGMRTGHQHRLLGHGVRAEIHMEPYMVTLEETSDVFPWFQHKGIEFIHILEGKMTYRHGDLTYTMHPGDSLFFDPQAIHGPEELEELPIKFLVVISYED